MITESERLQLGQVSDVELFAALKERLADMRTALLRDDAKAFAAAVVYPAYVNTASSCSAMIPDQETFRLHFGSIVDSAVRKAVLGTKEVGPWAGGAISVAGDRVWFPVGQRGFVFNPGTVWSLPGLACWQEAPCDLPSDFPRFWRVAKFCWPEDEPRRASFITRAEHLQLEPTSGSVAFTNASGASTSCRLDRVSDKFIGRAPMSLNHCLPPSEGLTLSLDCRKASENYVVWLVYTDGRLQVLGANNVVVSLEPKAAD